LYSIRPDLGCIPSTNRDKQLWWHVFDFIYGHAAVESGLETEKIFESDAYPGDEAAAVEPLGNLF
jgi:hypothetical protein